MRQRSDEWFRARLGYLTASRAWDVLRRNSRSGLPLAGYYRLLDELVRERLSGQRAWHYTSEAMAWGTDFEPQARGAYQRLTGLSVAQVGFIPHPRVAWLGASPDGLVGADGLLEIKCPTSPIHLKRLAAGAVPEKYKPQMLVQLLCTERRWVDFVDFDPRQPDGLRIFRVRYQPSENELSFALERCQEFLDKVERETRRRGGDTLPWPEGRQGRI